MDPPQYQAALDQLVDVASQAGRGEHRVLSERGHRLTGLLVQGRQEADPIKRKQVYLQLEQKLMDMAVVVPLVDQLSVFAMRPNVSGLKFTGNSYPLITDLSMK